MRALILGGTGMLGHKLIQRLTGPIEPFATVRGDGRTLARYGLYCPDQVVPSVDACDFQTVERALDHVQPHAVVNCIGIVKQSPLAKDPVATLTVNALFPHRLRDLCARRGARLVHVSTDCVFDGTKGGHKESDRTTAEDLYGRTKALGETGEAPALTLRTSIIGREIANRTGLVEWFLSQRGGTVRGYTRARFSGVTTDELARVIARVLLEHPDLTGLYHVASSPIDKCALLVALDRVYEARTEVVADDTVQVDRTLDGAAFRAATGYVAPDWDAMLAEMAADPTPYETWSN